MHGLTKKSIWEKYGCVSYEDVEFQLPEDDFTYRTLAASHSYEPNVSSHLFKRLPYVYNFVDVGANLGLFALPVAKKLPAGGHVYAFEVSPRNANLILKNTRRNSINNLTIYPVGLSDRNGSLYLTSDRKTSNNTLLAPGNESEDAYVVPVVKMDSFWDKTYAST